VPELTGKLEQTHTGEKSAHARHLATLSEPPDASRWWIDQITAIETSVQTGTHLKMTGKLPAMQEKKSTHACVDEVIQQSDCRVPILRLAGHTPTKS
jgi:hypothetical protein